MTAQLLSESNLKVQLIEDRQPGLLRRRVVTAFDQAGEPLHLPPWAPDSDAFLKDTQVCIGRCLNPGIEPGYITSDDILAVMALAEQITDLAVAV